MLNYNFPEEKQTYNPDDLDPVFDEAVKLIIETGMASSSLIQRRLKLGYARAARVIDQMEQAGIIGPANGSNPREILVKQLNGEWKHTRPSNPPQQKDPTEEEIEANWKKTKYSQEKSEYFEIDLGVDEKKNKVSLNLEKYGNLLVVGSQFTATADLLNNILVSSIARYSPKELRIVAIDLNKIDLVIPNLPTHLLTPTIVEEEKCLSAFKWTISEIERRYKLFREMGEIDIKKFNNRPNIKPIPNIMLLINSFNQAICFSPREVENSMTRIMETGRKVGVYVVIRNDLLDNKTAKIISANLPVKLVFKPTDKKIARETGIPESADLTSPNEAILETMYEGKTKLTVEKIDHKKIYEEIFE